MKYLLVVGFACDVYRQEPRARIFVGNKLIDEFYIPHHKDTLTPAIKKFRQDKQLLQPCSELERVNIQIKNSICIFIFLVLYFLFSIYLFIF